MAPVLVTWWEEKERGREGEGGEMYFSYRYWQCLLGEQCNVRLPEVPDSHTLGECQEPICCMPTIRRSSGGGFELRFAKFVTVQEEGDGNGRVLMIPVAVHVNEMLQLPRAGLLLQLPLRVRIFRLFVVQVEPCLVYYCLHVLLPTNNGTFSGDYITIQMVMIVIIMIS